MVFKKSIIFARTIILLTTQNEKDMKRILLLTLVAFCVSQGINAQSKKLEKFGIFDHVGVGLSVGTDGIGFDLAAPLTNYVAVRAGFAAIPAFKFNKNIHVNDNGDAATYYNKVDIETKVKRFDAKLLFDFYPFKKGSFHLTAGAYIGDYTLATIRNTSPILKNPADYGTAGLILGDYRITTDKNGNAEIKVKTNGFKPYVGLGFGRAVTKKRFTVSCDFGVQFWGRPGVYAKAKKGLLGEPKEHRFKYTDLSDEDDKDLKDAIKTIEKISVYPVLSIRLTGRLF